MNQGRSLSLNTFPTERNLCRSLSQVVAANSAAYSLAPRDGNGNPEQSAPFPTTEKKSSVVCGAWWYQLRAMGSISVWILMPEGSQLSGGRVRLFDNNSSSRLSFQRVAEVVCSACVGNKTPLPEKEQSTKDERRGSHSKRDVCHVDLLSSREKAAKIFACSCVLS